MSIAPPPGRVFKLTRSERRHLRLVPPIREASSLPMTRGECEGGARPCPLVSCRHNVCVDVSSVGTLTVHWLPDEEPDRPNCALDMAAAGGLSRDETGLLLGVSRQRVLQLEEQAERKMRAGMRPFREP